MDKKIAIVLDSTTLESDILLNHPDVYWVPLNVIVDGKTYEDKTEMNEADLLKLLDEGKSASTSQPSVQKAIEIFREIKAKHYNHFFIFSISSYLSGTLNTLAIGLKEAEIESYDLIDTYTIAGPVAYIAEKVLDEIAAGTSCSKIRQHVQDTIDSTSSYILVENLERLILSGRLNKTVGNLASAFKLKILLTLKNKGESIDLFSIFRNDKKLHRTILDILKQEKVNDKDYLIYLLEVDGLDKRMELESLIKQAYPELEIRYGTLPSVTVTHVGRGICGLQLLKNNLNQTKKSTK
ncbi:DegV family protein [Allofustis seminis]|uniref:DegV family protein n=1 Tax=Allofustis seminis TaxID=166939 RepID=UPI000368D971|nr:DegV family protein [Allofustis seminis]